MKTFEGKTAVLTGAGSGLGLECARIGAQRGMNLVLVDVQQDALDKAADELRAQANAKGARVLARRVDVADADQMQALANAVQQEFDAPHLVFNNAGVVGGGLVWENSVADWQWVLGVNLWGVVHGVRLFTPIMLHAAQNDPAYEGHIVNTASMAGLLSTPNMGIYNVGKHAVVTLSETLHHDLALVTEQIRASVLCPFFVPTAIDQSQRNRPAHLPAQPMTASQMISRAMGEKATSSGKVSAADIAQKVFDAVAEQRFYIYSHPHQLGSVQTRMEDVVQARNPTDPFAHMPALSTRLKTALRAAQAGGAVDLDAF